MSSQNAKILFCEAINSVYGEEHKVTDDDEDLFYSVKPVKGFKGLFNVLLKRDHPCYKLCLCMQAGYHKNSSKNRTYTVNVNSGAVWQKCWSKQCLRKDDRGRMALIVPESDESSSEDESEDDTEAIFTTKRRKHM